MPSAGIRRRSSGTLQGLLREPSRGAFVQGVPQARRSPPDGLAKGPSGRSSGLLGGAAEAAARGPFRSTVRSPFGSPRWGPSGPSGSFRSWGSLGSLGVLRILRVLWILRFGSVCSVCGAGPSTQVLPVLPAAHAARSVLASCPSFLPLSSAARSPQLAVRSSQSAQARTAARPRLFPPGQPDRPVRDGLRCRRAALRIPAGARRDRPEPVGARHRPAGCLSGPGVPAEFPPRYPPMSVPDIWCPCGPGRGSSLPGIVEGLSRQCPVRGCRLWRRT